MLPLILVLILAAAAPAAAQETRLPAPLYPGATLESLEAQLKLRPTNVDVPIEAIVLRARLLFVAGRFLESARSWQDAGDREPLLASFSRTKAARALLEAGDLDGASAAITRMNGAAPADILLGAADAARRAGQLDRAATLYQQARNGAGRTNAADDAALRLAATQEQAGRPGDALVTFRELQLTFRQAAAYDEADAGARRLSAALNGAEPLTEQDYEAISDRLTGVAAFRRAVDVLTEWRRAFPDSSRRGRIGIALIQNLYSLRANDEARAEAEAFLTQEPDGPDRASASRTLFSLAVREGNTADVERRGQAFLGGTVKGATLEQRQGVARLLAEYLVSVGQPSRALPVYDRLYRMTTGRAERIDVQWRTAVAALGAGNRTRAIALLRQLRRLTLDAETERATAYWLAYAQDAAGARANARTLWSDLVRRAPFSYYGVRAAARLGMPVPPLPSLVFPELSLSAAVTAHADYRLAALLSRAGLLEEAAFYARRLSATFRREDATALVAARASEAAGDASATSTLMSSFFGEYLEHPASGLPDDFWTLAYPRAYWTEVSAAAARHNVDPLLMIALARQESHFDPAVRSPVGAIGLFQIMPATAVELDPIFTMERADVDLTDAGISAELAARLLEQNLARFQGALAPTIAAYNADKDRVQVWWQAAEGRPEELFVDSIPYLQTRSYVRQVLANYGTYQRLAERSPSP